MFPRGSLSMKNNNSNEKNLKRLYLNFFNRDFEFRWKSYENSLPTPRISPISNYPRVR